jgi:putative peptidoglycan lipid II flippase
VEFTLLRSTLNARIGKTGLPASYVTKLWSAAIAGAAAAWAVKLSIPALPPVVAAILIVGPYGLVFLAVSLALRIEGAAATLRMALRR